VSAGGRVPPEEDQTGRDRTRRGPRRAHNRRWPQMVVTRRRRGEGEAGPPVPTPMVAQNGASPARAAAPSGPSRRSNAACRPLRRCATRDLSPCVALAMERLHVHPAASGPAVDEIASEVERSLRRPDTAAASFLLIGGRGSGKAAAAAAALEAIRGRVPDGEPRFVEVQLHGMLHARSVLSFSRALGSTLVAATGAPAASLVTEQDCNAVIARAVADLKAAGRGLVFVVADFDRFAPAGSAHMVLYKVLNLLQDNALGSAFVGMTTHHDAVDALEKRVKSRFLPREIAIVGFRDDNLDDVLGFLSAALTLPVAPGATGSGGGEGADGEAVEEFNAITAELLESRDFRAALARHLAGDRDVPRLVSAIHDTLLPLGEDNTPPLWGGRLSVEDFKAALGMPFTSVTDVLVGLSRLEMALLVALKRLEGVETCRSRGPIVFDDVYDEYTTVGTGGKRGYSATSGGGEAVAERSVAAKAWGRLVESNIVALSGTGPGASRHVALNVHASDVATALEQHPDMGAFLKRWGKGVGGIVS
jgi:Origin recognition complex (ORC) subunit 4 C-terminus